MAEKVGTFTLSSTGTVTTSGISFLPNSVEFVVCAKSGTDNASHMCVGAASDTTGSIIQWTRSTFADTTGAKSVNTTTKCLSHYERVSGTITEVLNASFSGFATNGGGDFGFTFNVTTANSSYQISYLARG